MKNFLVVGASSGIGYSIAQGLIAQGHTVYGTSRQERSSQTSNGIQWIQWEAHNAFDINAIPNDLHGMAYCVGAIPLKSFQRASDSDFLEDYNIQVLGAIRVLRAIYLKLKASGNASVVLFSTVAVQTGFPMHSIVSSSKGAIEGITRALAAEWAPSIRVNAIAPSLTDTPLAARLLSSDEKRSASAERHPLGRIGTPEDQAQMAIFLLSSASSWITGQVMHVDGGISNLKI